MTHGNSKYTPELGNKICELVAGGSNISVICQAEDMPPASTVYDWAYKNDDFAVKYARARELRADARSDRLDDIGRDTKAGLITPDVARVLVDIEKYQAGCEAPKRYGKQIQMAHSGNISLAGLIAESQKE